MSIDYNFNQIETRLEYLLPAGKPLKLLKTPPIVETALLTSINHGLLSHFQKDTLVASLQSVIEIEAGKFLKRSRCLEDSDEPDNLDDIDSEEPDDLGDFSYLGDN